MNILKKEFRLCLHPTAFIMPATCLLLLVPNYPYGVSYFYMTMSIFFICLSGRENRDAHFTLSLPVSRRDMVRGRVLLACCLEAAQVLCCAGAIWLKGLLPVADTNEAGLAANIALLGEGFILFALFNLIFFPVWYRDISKVGKPFLLASAALFLCIAAEIICTYAVPFVRDVLDTPDPAFLTPKLLVLLGGLLCWAGCSAWAVHLSARRFEKLDIQ